METVPGRCAGVSPEGIPGIHRTVCHNVKELFVFSYTGFGRPRNRLRMHGCRILDPYDGSGAPVSATKPRPTSGRRRGSRAVPFAIAKLMTGGTKQFLF